MRRGSPLAVLLVLLCTLLAAGAAHAQTFPPFTGYVVDNANVIPPAEEQALAQKLEALEKSTHRQLVVATIADLQGYPIEDYGYRLGRSWGVGMKDVNNGIILIVAPGERKVRIEVGYGLTPIVTDALSWLIIDGTILPRFREGNLPGGIVAGADALIAQLAAPDAEAQAKVAQALAAREKADQGSVSPLILWGVIIAVFVIVMILRNSRGGRKHRRGRGPVVIWGPGWGSGWSSGSSGGGWSSGGGFGGGGGFSGGGGGSFGGGGASGSW